MDIDQSIQESLAGFETLWRRVTGRERAVQRQGTETPAPRFREEETLQALIREEQWAAAWNAAFARQFQGGGRAVLLAQAREARSRAGRLRGEYFICTGLSCAPKAACPPVSGRMTALRTAMLRQERLAQDYAQAAAQTAVPALRALYQDYAA
ncbi:MAG: hypothetical protein LUG57_07980, partial [Oscillospiraceae bacterium]|nr:hypothetical protein [Oscillospiraceae bacterium]